MKNKVIVFDLDDTLYKEIDFLVSAYKEIILRLKIDFNIEMDFDHLFSIYQKGNNVFENILSSHKNKKLNIEYLLNIYRYHFPNISLRREVKDFLFQLLSEGFILGLITDGRSITQRNKLRALGIQKIFSEIVISEEFGHEKPHLANYEHFQIKYPNSLYFYIGDNLRKDFISPNSLAWKTVGVRDIKGANIHSQVPENFKQKYLPTFWINDISELKVDDLD
ncbi:HAD-IA family hydrolase [Lutimonas halocynthiae]|uniref:HAD family hydrolase n=1 Tax=Lutimonas halocynthiae TaxID=1446477 RepID=UPI0025B2BF9E|nr:HAD-IA family hydrolase [Lutimonas halocynthiae]MDN3643799.1 HAD-IA family hydrolase [Lutimonas halocynthiae]